MMYDRYGHGSGDVFAWVFMLMMMALVVLGVVFVVRYLNRSTHNDIRADSALETLKNRYAKGEIEKKEFDEKQKDLNG